MILQHMYKIFTRQTNKKHDNTCLGDTPYLSQCGDVPGDKNTVEICVDRGCGRCKLRSSPSSPKVRKSLITSINRTLHRCDDCNVLIVLMGKSTRYIGCSRIEGTLGKLLRHVVWELFINRFVWKGER
jgi:hypothetical protein